MHDIRLIYAEDWNFDLYISNRKYIITVVFSDYNNFSQMENFKSFELTDNEISSARKYSDFKTIADKIRNNYIDNVCREINPYILLTGDDTSQTYNSPEDKFTT